MALAAGKRLQIFCIMLASSCCFSNINRKGEVEEQEAV